DPDARRLPQDVLPTSPLRRAYIPEDDHTLPPEDRTLPPELFDSEPTRVNRGRSLSNVGDDEPELTALDPGTAQRARTASQARARGLSDPSVTVQEPPE